MWNYIILASIWIGIIFKWLIPVIRQHIVYEIYEEWGSILPRPLELVLDRKSFITAYWICPLSSPPSS